MLQNQYPDILTRIVATKREELALCAPLIEQWEGEADLRLATRRDFRAALAARTPAIIAEVKKASPSKGVLAADFDPARIARTYQRGGAAALSVLTDTPYFQGSLADLQAARAAVEIPVLRKDFTIATSQILQAAAHGADAILLIAAILTERELRDFREAAGRYGLAALVEVHNRRELDAAHRQRRHPDRRQQPQPAHLRSHPRDLARTRAPHAGRRAPGQRKRHPPPPPMSRACAPPDTRPSWWAST